MIGRLREAESEDKVGHFHYVLEVDLLASKGYHGDLYTDF
jgi:hypothetical protein